MAEHNPYAPSRATLEGTTRDEAAGGAWRELGVLVLTPGAPLPPRCVKCNAAADEPTKPRRVYWHNPAVYILLIISVPVYVIVALIIRKKAVVPAGLCANHKRRRVLAITLGWLGTLLGFGTMIAGSSSGGALVGGLVLMLASMILGLIFARVVYAKKIDEAYVRLKGCGANFLDTLPEFPG